MREYDIEVPKEVVNYLEGLSYEITTRQNIIQRMLESNANIEGDSFKLYSKQLSDCKR